MYKKTTFWSSLLCYLFVYCETCHTLDFGFDAKEIIKELRSEELDLKLHLRYHMKNRKAHKVNFDPDLFLNTSELIRSKGYFCEEHDTETEDGFILTMQRIPPKQKQSFKPIIFLQHGLLDSSATWVINFPNQSLGFLLADEGWDVWLGNIRGNTYSQKHTKYNINSAEFWNWSWDEMVKYDIPAMLQYVSKITSSKNITYIGHSQGTLVAFASLSRDREVQKLVNKYFALAPVATLGNIKGFIKLFSKYVRLEKMIFSIVGVYEFLPSNHLVSWILGHLCSTAIIRKACNTIMLMGGLSYHNANLTRIPVYITHDPAGTSVRNMVHFGQLVNSGKFQMYDYFSTEENLKHYNQPKPPLYYLKDIKTPTFIFYGGKDQLSTPEDSLGIINNLTNVVWAEKIDDYEHLDFIWGFNAAEVLYKKIIKFINISL